jgi:hypothetical protein
VERGDPIHGPTARQGRDVCLFQSLIQLCLILEVRDTVAPGSSRSASSGNRKSDRQNAGSNFAILDSQIGEKILLLIPVASWEMKYQQLLVFGLLMPLFSSKKRTDVL